MTPASSNVIKLKDNRDIGFALWGSPTFEYPIIYFHGFPGSRLEVEFAHEHALKMGLSIISPDRPGFGLSTFHKHRTILDWPNDVLALADHLGFSKFAVLGISGGCPYALACANQIPERLEKVVTVSGLAPVNIPGLTDSMIATNRLMLSLARSSPWLVTPIVKKLARALRRHPGILLRWLISISPESDKKILRIPSVKAILKGSFQEALKGDENGASHELSLISHPWRFRLEEIKIPVQVWHGISDSYVPFAMGQYLARVIPHCQSNFIEGQGHFMVISHIERILHSFREG